MDKRQELRSDLYTFVGRELHELAWENRFPLHPGIGVSAFLDGFRDFGIDVEVDGEGAYFPFNVDLGDSPYILGASMTFGEIRKGWGRSPEGCPSSLYDAIYEVYDRIGKELREDPNAKPYALFSGDMWADHFWQKKRQSEPRRIRELMENHFKKAFLEHHEHVLVPVSGSIPELGEPQLVHSILDRFPFHLLEESIDYAENWEVYQQFDYQEHPNHRVEILLNARRGPTEETLLEMPWDDFDYKYHPSESTLISLFWGQYLNVLRQEKSYPINSYGRTPLRDLVVCGAKALESGHAIEWGNQK